MKRIFYLIIIIGFMAFPSCKKTHKCFDQELYNQFKNSNCPQDCPGVKGCDGKTYCNSCIANGHGIRTAN